MYNHRLELNMTIDGSLEVVEVIKQRRNLLRLLRSRTFKMMMSFVVLPYLVFQCPGSSFSLLYTMKTHVDTCIEVLEALLLLFYDIYILLLILEA